MEWYGSAKEKNYFCNILNFIQEKVFSGNDDYPPVCSVVENFYIMRDSKGDSLLHYSCRDGDSYMTEWLINSGLDINARNYSGESPLMVAFKNSHEQVVKVLLRYNAVIDSTDNYKETIFDKIALMGPITDSIIPGALLLKFLEKCTTVEEAAQKLYDVRCPLNVVMLLKNCQITEWLLKHGVRDVEGYDNPPALHVSVYYHDLKSIEILLNYVDINATDSEGGGPLTYVRESEFCGNEHLVILKTLLDRGARLTTRYAVMNCTYIQSYKILLRCKKETIGLLLQTNFDLNAKDGLGNMALHFLADNKNPGIGELLQDKIFDVEARNNDDLSILESAASVNNVEIVKLLLEKKANVNAQNSYGHTPLFFAMICPSKSLVNIKCVDLLIEYGADTQLVTHQGMTIFDVVLQHYTFSLIQPVLAYLARLEVTGTKINDKIRMKIKSDRRFEIPYNLYKHEIERLKHTVVLDSVTMFKLLIDSDEKILIYLRNAQLRSNYRKIAHKEDRGTFYQMKIQDRVKNGLRIIYLQQRTATVLSKVVQFSYKSHPTIMDVILSYLTKEDLQNVAQLKKIL